MSSGSPKNGSSSSASGSLVMIGAGIAVFIVCSIVQGAGGSSMFSTSFTDPDNAIQEILMQVTWWPGWIATVMLIGGGVVGLLDRGSQPAAPVPPPAPVQTPTPIQGAQPTLPPPAPAAASPLPPPAAPSGRPRLPKKTLS